MLRLLRGIAIIVLAAGPCRAENSTALPVLTNIAQIRDDPDLSANNACALSLSCPQEPAAPTSFWGPILASEPCGQFSSNVYLI